MAARFTSQTNDVTMASDNGNRFVRAALWLNVRRCARGMVRPNRRTPDVVRRVYDGERERLGERAAAMTWEDLQYGDSHTTDFVLVDDRVIWTVLTEPRACNLRRLEAAVRLLPDKSPTIVEFGSGTGRNLLHLQRLFPASRCIGLELSPVSVELARSLAARFQLNVEFHACDVTQSVPLEAHSASLVFSCHALEQMPRLFPAVIARMCDTSSSVVLMLEPIPTLWPWNTRGIASRLRVRALDRLRGVMPALRRVVSSGEWEILMRERLRSGSNPLNETCEVLLRRRINPV